MHTYARVNNVVNGAKYPCIMYLIKIFLFIDHCYNAMRTAAKLCGSNVFYTA